MAEKLSDDAFQFDDKEQTDRDTRAEHSRDKKLLKDFLTALGGTSKEIAKTLKRMGIKGIRHLPTYDPIAVATKAKFSCDSVYVFNGMVIVSWDGDNGEEGRSVMCLMPDIVQEFVTAFDSGEYRKLEFDLDKAIRKAGKKND